MISNVRQHPKLNLGQLNAYKLMFAIKLLMETHVKNILDAGFSDLPSINATVMEPWILIVKISISSLYHDIVRPTEIFNNQ